jgi:predicted DCC family thiol-disulfide oxidoreductase YuxK
MTGPKTRPLGSPGEPNGHESGRITVFYDFDCAFCRWTVRQLRLIDRAHRLEFIPLQAAALRPDRPELAALAASRPLDVDLHVVLPDGRVESGSRAVLEILFVLPGGVLFRPWPRIPGLPQVLDAGYRRVADHRSLLARLLRID